MGLQFHPRLVAALFLTGMGMSQQSADRTIVPGIGETAEATELKAESAIYLQRRLGLWMEGDARKVFGAPRRRRDALEEGVVTGMILRFADPTRRYREFELLFDHQTKTLRAAYIYPWRMSWDDCRELWGEDANMTELPNGNVFRSYRTRHLDVLLDKAGTVINLGIY